ncbi:hypothetical protein D9M72_394500 [compost metagenome]
MAMRQKEKFMKNSPIMSAVLQVQLEKSSTTLFYATFLASGRCMMPTNTRKKIQNMVKKDIFILKVMNTNITIMTIKLKHQTKEKK